MGNTIIAHWLANCNGTFSICKGIIARMRTKGMKSMNDNTEEKKARIAPEDQIMELLAQLPEDTKKMVLAYAQGVASGKKLARAGA